MNLGRTCRRWKQFGNQQRGGRVDRRGASDALYAESKVELPRRALGREVAVLVREGDADLYDLEQVDVAAHGLVVVVRRRLEAAYRAGDDAGEFGVL